MMRYNRKIFSFFCKFSISECKCICGCLGGVAGLFYIVNLQYLLFSFGPEVSSLNSAYFQDANTIFTFMNQEFTRDENPLAFSSLNQPLKMGINAT